MQYYSYREMTGQAVKVRRETLEACMTCPLCNNILKDATTISLCLHTFCRICIYEKLSDEEVHCCPVCNIYLGCLPVEKLRHDHNLEDIRGKIFPHKRRKIRAPEVMPSVASPRKRKERSLSSLVVSAPEVEDDKPRTNTLPASGKNRMLTAARKRAGTSQALSASAQALPDVAGAKSNQRDCPNWFSFVPYEDQKGDEGEEAGLEKKKRKAVVVAPTAANFKRLCQPSGAATKSSRPPIPTGPSSLGGRSSSLAQPKSSALEQEAHLSIPSGNLEGPGVEALPCLMQHPITHEHIRKGAVLYLAQQMFTGVMHLTTLVCGSVDVLRGLDSDRHTNTYEDVQQGSGLYLVQQMFTTLVHLATMACRSADVMRGLASDRNLLQDWKRRAKNTIPDLEAKLCGMEKLWDEHSQLTDQVAKMSQEMENIRKENAKLRDDLSSAMVSTKLSSEESRSLKEKNVEPEGELAKARSELNLLREKNKS